MEITEGECGCSASQRLDVCPLHKSAPKLYEACKEALSFLVRVHDLVMEHPIYIEGAKKADSKLWQAIAKAEEK